MNTEFTLKELQAENTGLRSQLQMQALELYEYRRVLLALVRGIETKAEDELELQDAREVLARGGLL